MKKSKLYQLLDQFDAKTRLRLRLFLQSPYYNRNTNVLELFDLIIDAINQNSEITKEIAFNRLFLSTTYSDLKMRRLMNDLLNLTESFLIIESNENQPIQQKINLLKRYRELRLAKHSNFVLNQIKNLFNRFVYRNANYHQLSSQLHYEEYLNIQSDPRKSTQQLQRVSDSLDLAFLCSKLKHACYMASKTTLYNKEYDLGLLRVVLPYIEHHQLTSIPAIALYYNAYRAFTESDDEIYFNKLRTTTLDYGHLFPQEEIQELYLLSINYCVLSLNKGNKAYLKKGLDLYKEGLHQGHLLNNQQISRTTYSNVVAMGLKSKEYEWVLDFIHKYQPLLPKHDRESTFAFCLARYQYDLENYDEAIRLLLDFDYPDIITGLVAKTLLLKIYFETQEFQLLDAHLYAMDVFLRRKKVLGYHKKNYQTIIQYTKKLTRLNFYDKIAVQKLRGQIEEGPVFTEKEWFLNILK